MIATRAARADRPGAGGAAHGFGADGLDLSIYFWIGDPENGPGQRALRRQPRACSRALDEAGVEIPFPQRVVRQIVEAAPSEAPSR